jgi:hypothetical protein
VSGSLRQGARPPSTGLVPLYVISILGGLTGAAVASRNLDLVLLVAAAGALAGAAAAGTLARRPAPV